MPTGYVFHPIYLAHDKRGHPENRERLEAIITHLNNIGLLAQLTSIPARPVDLDLLYQIHSEPYCRQVQAIAERGGGFLDPDTYISLRSYDAALMSAGGVVEATKAVLDGRVLNAFALVRPPGHHARPQRGMGFCLFNNIALAARYALSRRDLERILIIDFDVHHGNGTQEAFFAERDVLFFSTHQYPFYPGTGNWSEIGTGDGEGCTVNVPLAYGVGDAGFQQIIDELLFPLAMRYRPELILVSAGYDAHWSDPLAGLNLSIAGYNMICQRIKELAGDLCQGRLVLTLEGGYNQDVLSHCVANTFRILCGQPSDALSNPFGPSPYPERPVTELVRQLRTVHGLE